MRRFQAQAAAGIAGSLILGLVSTSALAQTKTVRFLHNETDPPSIEFYNKAIKEFEAANPDIKIEMEAVSTDGRLQKVLASINTKTMPEIFKLLPEERFEFARKGYLVPLDDVIAEIGSQDYVEGSLVPVEGKTYDIPYTLGNYGVLWQRDDLLKAKGLETPKTWDELKTAAKTLTEDGNFGFIFPAGKNRMTSIYLSAMIWNAGGTYFDKDLNVTFDNPGTVKALTFLKEMAAYSPSGHRLLLVRRHDQCLSDREDRSRHLCSSPGRQCGRQYAGSLQADQRQAHAGWAQRRCGEVCQRQ